MSAYTKRSSKTLNVLEKRIPKNPRYEDVEPVVDSGHSLSKHLRKIEEDRQNYRFRKDELFKRMKVTTFTQLMIQVAEINSMERDAALNEGDRAVLSARPDTSSTRCGDTSASGDETTRDEGKENGGHENGASDRLQIDTDHEHNDTLLELMTTRSTLEGITRGVGEFDVIEKTESPKPALVDETRPYLLLDVRTPDEFAQCHLITAESFPIAMLSRSVNYESKELLAYRNQPGKIIVLYDEDERIAPKAATTMVERGYDNLFMLSGGMKVAYKYFPNGLLTGAIPDSLTPPRKQSNKRHPPGVATAPIRLDFDHNDLYLLNMQLDDALDDKTSSSRLSRAATEATRSRVSQMSARSNATITSTSTVGSRPPFR